MTLEITLHTSYFGGDTRQKYNVNNDELERGADIASLLPEKERAIFSPFKAYFIDSETLEIDGPAGKQQFPTNQEGWYETESVLLSSSTVVIEGNSYDNDNEVKVWIKIKP